MNNVKIRTRSKSIKNESKYILLFMNIEYYVLFNKPFGEILHIVIYFGSNADVNNMYFVYTR